MPPPSPDRNQPQGLSRTIPLDAAEEPVRSSPAEATDGPRLARPAIGGEAGAPPGSEPAAATSPRFANGDCLGIGASGQVYAVLDRNLQRSVAVKVILPEQRAEREAVAHLINEARLTASLSHPNVLPVYDLDTDDQGRTYFSMKKVEGRSLGDEIQHSTRDGRAAAIATSNRIASIFIGISQALAYAHRQRIVHQDVKPDNIMLGAYGEVLVVDWGSAVRLDPAQRPKLYGTPLYMSPEQARVESVDARSDVYCLGATLFHVLVLRPPTLAETAEEFWEKKKRGVIDALTPQERRWPPVALLAICLKALAVEPHERYQDAQELLQDLQAFQAGLAISAYHDSAWGRLRRWHRRHGKAAWSGVVVGTLIVTVLGLVYGQRVEAIAHWGRPQVVEDFTDDSWQEHWKTLQGSFIPAVTGGIVSSGGAGNILLFDRKFSGATAIEYDAECVPGCHVCDLSVVWCQDATFSADGSRVTQWKTPTLMQFGAYDGTCSAIVVGDKAIMVSYHRDRPVLGRTYHIRAQIADGRADLSVDGQVVCSWLDPFSYSSGYIGLYGFYPGKNFRHVRIYSRGVARKVPVTAIGEAFLQAGHYDQAAKEFARVADSYPGTALGREAAYRQGLCLYRLGDGAAAEACWQPLRDSEYAGEIALQDIDALVAKGDHAQALSRMRSLYRTGDHELRLHIALAWEAYMGEIMHDQRDDLLSQYLAVHDEVFQGEEEVDRCAAVALGRLSRFQELVDRYPDQRPAVADALLHLCQDERVISDYADQVYAHDTAVIHLGDFVANPTVVDPGLDSLRLVLQGRYEEVARLHPDEHALINVALVMSGHGREALSRPTMDGYIRAQIQADEGIDITDPHFAFINDLDHGRYDTVLANDSPPYWIKIIALNAKGMAAWRAGDLTTARADFTAATYGLLPGYPTTWDPDIGGSMFRMLAVPWLQAVHDGRPQDFVQHLHTLLPRFGRYDQQRISYQGRYLLGELTDEQFLAQPCQVYIQAMLLVVKGMRAELAGDRTLARTCYQGWLDLPARQRGLVPDPAWTDFMRWRIEQLGPGAVAPGGTPAPSASAPSGALTTQAAPAAVAAPVAPPAPVPAVAPRAPATTTAPAATPRP